MINKMRSLKPLELYLHIPFCVSKCKYCDFLSAPASDQERQNYIESLCRKIRSYGTLAKAYRVISIFVGGGTPSILEPWQVEAVFGALRETFLIEKDAEITIEANPGTVTKEKLSVYRHMGINRLSIGLQSVNKEELKALGRIHTFEDFLNTYQMAREEGFQNINVDLISAIPFQTPESWKKTLKKVAELLPEHISAYSLIIEEGTPFYQRYGDESKESLYMDELPCEEEERQMYWDTKEILSAYGYHRYEISNYAKEGYECRHNLGYWNRTEYLGIGTAAASFMDQKRWIEGEEPEALSVREQMEEYMFLGLRKMEGVSIEKFSEEFGKSMESVYGKVICDMKEKGLLEIQGDFLRLTEQGIDVSNYVMSEFLFG